MIVWSCVIWLFIDRKGRITRTNPYRREIQTKGANCAPFILRFFVSDNLNEDLNIESAVKSLEGMRRIQIEQASIWTGFASL